MSYGWSSCYKCNKDPLNFYQTESTVSRLINGHIGLGPEMAVRLSIAFPNTEPAFWINLQKNHDLFHASKKAKQLSRKVQVMATAYDGVS